MVTTTVTSGKLSGTTDDDTLIGVAQKGTGQIHIYAGRGDDLIHLDFSDNFHSFNHGHHARGDDDPDVSRGADTFNFRNTHNVGAGAVIVGRLEDIEARDTICLEGQAIDLFAPPGNVRIVEFNGGHADEYATPQQWILITTSAGGHIFYALEGARVDMGGYGGANSGDHENHFLSPNQLPVDFSQLTDVEYFEKENYIPEGYVKGSKGIAINDVDDDAEDVIEIINGTNDRDLISAGLNDDTVYAMGGSDAIWGGSGHDTIDGGAGSDFIKGGSGEDFLTGGGGRDNLWGGHQNDLLRGLSGNDRLFGEVGDDKLHGNAGNDLLNGGAGHDFLNGSDGQDVLVGQGGNDLISGGKHKDIATGGNGSDVFIFATGDLVDWDKISGDEAGKTASLDVISDFQVGTDLIDFSGYSGVASLADLRCWETFVDGNRYFTIKVHATNERVIVDADETVSWAAFFSDAHFIFA